MNTPTVELITIPKGRNEYGWFVYVGMIDNQRVEFRFDYRPSIAHVKKCMLSKLGLN